MNSATTHIDGLVGDIYPLHNHIHNGTFRTVSAQYQAFIETVFTESMSSISRTLGLFSTGWEILALAGCISITSARHC